MTKTEAAIFLIKDTLSENVSFFQSNYTVIMGIGKQRLQQTTNKDPIS